MLPGIRCLPACIAIPSEVIRQKHKGRLMSGVIEKRRQVAELRMMVDVERIDYGGCLYCQIRLGQRHARYISVSAESPRSHDAEGYLMMQKAISCNWTKMQLHMQCPIKVGWCVRGQLLKMHCQSLVRRMRTTTSVAAERKEGLPSSYSP